VTVGDLTLKTTDSGIGSIAHRPTRRSTSSRQRRLVDSHVLSGTGSADDEDEDEPTSAAVSVGASDVDVALMWHLARCWTIVQVSLRSFYLAYLPLDVTASRRLLGMDTRDDMIWHEKLIRELGH